MMSAASIVSPPNKVVRISSGPLDAPGFTFTATGLEIDQGVTYDQWVKYGRKLQLADKGIQWALGDWLIHGETYFTDRCELAVEFTGLKVKTLQNYATVAKAVTKSRRRDSDVVSFSTHADVATLPEDEQEKILSAAAAKALTREQARKQARRVKRKLNLLPDETVLIQTPEVQEYLASYVQGLTMMQDRIPLSAGFLHGMVDAHIGQAQWQMKRTVETDCGAILDTFEDAPRQTDDLIFKRLLNSGHYISDPDLDVRLAWMSRHYDLTDEDRKNSPHVKGTCECSSLNKTLKKDKQGGKKETQRGDRPDLYSIAEPIDDEDDGGHWDRDAL